MEGVFSAVVYFGTAVSVPFFMKQFVRLSPFPFFNSMIVDFVSTGLSFTLAYTSRGIPSLFSWMIPNSKSEIYMMMAAIFYSVSCAMSHVCYLYSGIDFTAVFSVFSLVIESILAMTFTDFQLPGNCVVALIVIVFGLIIMCSDFSWGTELAPASTQILAQTVLWSSTAMYSFCYSKLRSFVAAYETLPVCILNTWIHGIALIPLSIVFLTSEARNLRDINGRLGIDFLTLVLFGAASRELLSISEDFLASLPGYGWAEYASRLKCLPILLISYTVYHETRFAASQGIGITLTLFGYVLYSLSAERKRRPDDLDGDSDGDTVALLDKGMKEGEAFMET